MGSKLSWYENAKLDDVREAYGKTWHVVRIENDITIHWGTSYCGESQAITPRTHDSPTRDDSPYVLTLNDIRSKLELDSNLCWYMLKSRGVPYSMANIKDMISRRELTEYDLVNAQMCPGVGPDLPRRVGQNIR